jgi:hypothetical protein
MIIILYYNYGSVRVFNLTYPSLAIGLPGSYFVASRNPKIAAA